MKILRPAAVATSAGLGLLLAGTIAAPAHAGIYEVGALHDWVHVLADYGTDPEGEIDVFAFIAATMTDQRGFLQFVFTLALFQNGSVDTVGGKKVALLPNATLLAQAWDETAAARAGEMLAGEGRAQDVDVVLGPTVNLHRSPLGGRLFEAYAEDPLLSGRLAAAYIRGIQRYGIGACVKHYVANESETQRDAQTPTESRAPAKPGTASRSSTIADSIKPV